MRSSARTRANRRNAQLSTGPRTPEGKSKISQNARTHGLSAARISADKRLLVDALAQTLHNDGVHGDPYPLASAMADLARIHQIRTAVSRDPSDLRARVQILERLDRYERRARTYISRLTEAHDLGLMAKHKGGRPDEP